MADGTYVYCVVANRARPRLVRRARRLPGMGPVRLLDVERGLFLAVADAPLARYGAEAINRGLGNLDWVSRAALAHQAVIESFAAATAVLPMKLFTIFTSDERALAHVRGARARIAAAVGRVANQQEWGVRVILDGGAARSSGTPAPEPARSNAMSSGVAYLTRKKAQRDAGIERAGHARETVAAVYERLSARAKLARRKTASELPVQGGPLLLDAAFLVPRGRARAFAALAGRERQALARQGYGLTLTGPWPPYSFVGE